MALGGQDGIRQQVMIAYDCDVPILVGFLGCVPARLGCRECGGENLVIVGHGVLLLESGGAGHI